MGRPFDCEGKRRKGSNKEERWTYNFRERGFCFISKSFQQEKKVGGKKGSPYSKRRKKGVLER